MGRKRLNPVEIFTGHNPALIPVVETDNPEITIDNWKKGAVMPDKITVKLSDIILKLEQSFALGATISEACFYAGISRDTYYRWIKEKPQLKTRFENLQLNPVLLAKDRVIKGISESYANAMDYLKRKAPMEFGDRSFQLNATLNAERVIYTISERELADIEEGKAVLDGDTFIIKETIKETQQ